MSTALAEAPASTTNDELFETVDGVRVEIPPMGAFAVTIASELVRILGNYVINSRLGLVLSEALYLIRDEPRQERRPDVSYVSRERLQGTLPPLAGAWDIFPDLAIEVVSPSNAADEIDGKVTEYLDAGVRQVWVLYPESRRLYIHRSRRDVSVFNADDPISVGDLFPGLDFRLADIYAAVDSLVE